MSRGSVALGLRISAGFCAGLPACPGSAAARDLRRAAELQRAADRHRQRPFERLRILAANGLQTPDPNPESISGCGALTPPKHEAWSNSSTKSRVGWNSPPPCSPERGSISNAKNSVPCRVWACPDHRRTAQEGARSDRHKGGGTASTGGLSGARQAVGSGRGRERIQAPADQGEPSQAISSSLASGHTTASVALKRLVACSAKNRFCRAKPGSGVTSSTG